MEIFGIDKKRNKRYNRLTRKRENKSERKVLHMANIQAIPVPEETKAIKIQFRQKPATNGNVKYTRDGRVKLTHSNAVEGESSKTYAIKDKTVLAEYVKFYKDRAKCGTPYMMEYAYIELSVTTATAEYTPGSPSRASTSSPLSSPMAGKPVAAQTASALMAAFPAKVLASSSMGPKKPAAVMGARV